MRIDRSASLLLIATGVIFTLGTSALAAPKKKAALEVYTAEDPDASPADEDALLNGPDEAPNSDAGNAWAETAGSIPVHSENEGTQEPVPPAPPVPAAEAATPVAQAPLPATPSATHKAPAGWGMFDNVPDTNRKIIAERLKWAAILIQKHGRAYDYRVHTVRQLKQILKVLESQTP